MEEKRRHNREKETERKEEDYIEDECERKIIEEQKEKS